MFSREKSRYAWPVIVAIVNEVIVSPCFSCDDPTFRREIMSLVVGSLHGGDLREMGDIASDPQA